MKLAIGTVQFGLEYGVANKSGQVSSANIVKILHEAKNLGIDTLDTAAAYGNSEVLLGCAGVDSFKVISKLPPRDPGDIDATSWVARNVESSLENLKLKALYGFLLHRPLELLSRDGERLYQKLLDLQRQGLISRLGVSVYSPEDLEKLVSHIDLELVQLPMNLFDRRFIESGWLERLKAQGAEIHVRSAFLQGLMLISPSNRPAYFRPWKNLFNAFDAWLEKENLSALEACVGFLNNVHEVDKIVVGVDSVEQLLEISCVARGGSIVCPEYLKSNELALINPALWKL